MEVGEVEPAASRFVLGRVPGPAVWGFEKSDSGLRSYIHYEVFRIRLSIYFW